MNHWGPTLVGKNSRNGSPPGGRKYTPKMKVKKIIMIMTEDEVAVEVVEVIADDIS